MNQQKLKTELSQSAYEGLSDQECFDLLTDKSITTKQSISRHDIQKYLALEGKLIPIETNSAEARRMLEVFDEFSMDEQKVETAVTNMLIGLVVANLINDDDKAAILAMGEREEKAFPNVKLWEVQEARA